MLFNFFLGVSDVKLPTCTTVSEGHVISLTVRCDLDADLDNKVGSFRYMLASMFVNVIDIHVVALELIVSHTFLHVILFNLL